MVVTFIIIICLYLLLIVSLIIGFDAIKTETITNQNPKTAFSVIIPFRNEAQNLPHLINSILQLQYPKHLFEIILVDDDSEDASINTINNCFNLKGNIIDYKILKNQRLTQSPKKDAITCAIKQAKYDWIITTDADCILPKHWLTSFSYFIQQHPVKMVAGPVTYHYNKSLLHAFQALDFISLIGATIGGFGIKKPFLSNGANLAYKKDFFETLNGFNGNTNIASGDDIFLMEKALLNNPNTVTFLKNKNAIVITKPLDNLKDLIAQRVRWASKTSNYNNTFAKLVGVLVLFANAILIIGLVISLIKQINFKTVGILFTLKSCVDFILIYKTSQFLNNKNILHHFLWSCFIYPFFSVYIAFTSLFTTYKWKGRSFKK
ncbi:glycosyltransferase [uncultured Olleya sp.]|uniref:glycosyltransferase n=1 Tax=uncultured Olleya sp. TaxID=757243 RepID=UPI00259AB719|nr:glycosyltransferase [uncultured Olleya sp.]